MGGIPIFFRIAPKKITNKLVCEMILEIIESDLIKAIGKVRIVIKGDSIKDLELKSKRLKGAKEFLELIISFEDQKLKESPSYVPHQLKKIQDLNIKIEYAFEEDPPEFENLSFHSAEKMIEIMVNTYYGHFEEVPASDEFNYIYRNLLQILEKRWSPSQFNFTSVNGEDIFEFNKLERKDTQKKLKNKQYLQTTEVGQLYLTNIKDLINYDRESNNIISIYGINGPQVRTYPEALLFYVIVKSLEGIIPWNEAYKTLYPYNIVRAINEIDLNKLPYELRKYSSHPKHIYGDNLLTKKNKKLYGETYGQRITVKGEQIEIYNHCLELREKNIKDFSEIEGLDKLTNLQSLSLERNRITEIKGLEKFSNLRSLILSSNLITEMKGLDKLINLEHLDLWGNEITEIKGLDKLTNLQTLRLGRNKITEIKGLDKLTNLQNLNLELNQITEIRGLDKLMSLRELTLYKNKITNMKGLDKLASLRHVILSGNQISEIMGLEKLMNLQSLTLGSNKITEIKRLDKLMNLEWLLLSENKITEIKGLDKLTNLQTLYLIGNQITDIKGLDKLSSLQELYLWQNNIPINIIKECGGLNKKWMANDAQKFVEYCRLKQED